MQVDYPENYSVLVVGPPGVGKFEYTLELARDFLAHGQRVVFVTLDASPNEFRRRADEIGLDLAKYENGAFALVDCFSAYASERIEALPSKGLYMVSGYSNLEGIGMAISRAAHELGPPARIFFYTISTLFLHNSTQAIAKFFQIITSRIKTHVGFILYAVHEGVHEPTTMNLLRSLVDGVVEMRFDDALGREIRVHHLRGLVARPAWERFEPTRQIGTLPGGT